MPIFNLKNVKFVKTTKYYGPKKSIGCPFFPFFVKKSLFSCPYFVKKTSIFYKTVLPCPHFVKKTSFLSKTQCSDVIFLKFFMKNPQCHALIWPKIVKSIKTRVYFGQKTIIGWLFFLFFKSMLSCPYFVKKTSIL